MDEPASTCHYPFPILSSNQELQSTHCDIHNVCNIPLTQGQIHAILITIKKIRQRKSV